MLCRIDCEFIILQIKYKVGFENDTAKFVGFWFVEAHAHW